MKNGDKEILAGLIKMVKTEGIDNWSRETAIDLLRSYEKWQKFASVKQSEFAQNLPKSAYEKLEQKKRDREQLDNIPEGEILRTGDRRVVSGKILSKKEQEAGFWHNSYFVVKVLLDIGYGRKVWVTGQTAMNKGETWSAKMTIKATDDPTFLIGSRPSEWIQRSFILGANP